MSLGLIGRKVGMSRIFTEDGESIPVTLLFVLNNRIGQIKTTESDGYNAVQLAFGQRRRSRVNKSAAGHLAKAGIEAGEVLQEFRVEADDIAALSAGQIIVPEAVFQVGDLIRVRGTSKGKGFAGTIKRHNFSSGRASHGNSRSHNVPGSIGMSQDPGRVFPGKRMCGQMGNVKVTQPNLEIVRIDAESGVLFVKGSVPGAPDGIVTIRQAANAKPRANSAEGAQS